MFLFKNLFKHLKVCHEETSILKLIRSINQVFAIVRCKNLQRAAGKSEKKKIQSILGFSQHSLLMPHKSKQPLPLLFFLIKWRGGEMGARRWHPAANASVCRTSGRLIQIMSLGQVTHRRAPVQPSYPSEPPPPPPPMCHSRAAARRHKSLTCDALWHVL